MTIIPYLDFNGNCEAALHWYKDIFDGEIVYLQRFEDGPDMGISKEHIQQIMHAQLRIDDMVLYLSDNFPGSPPKTDSRVTLNIALSDEQKATKLFDALAQQGNIIMPFEKQFWGDTFGSLTDKFGISWSINLNKE